jgi:hypothetical protein
MPHKSIDSRVTKPCRRSRNFTHPVAHGTNAGRNAFPLDDGAENELHGKEIEPGRFDLLTMGA